MCMINLYSLTVQAGFHSDAVECWPDTQATRVRTQAVALMIKAYFEIIMLYQLYLYISKTRNHLLFVINITNLSVILYLISIN